MVTENAHGSWCQESVCGNMSVCVTIGNSEKTWRSAGLHYKYERSISDSIISTSMVKHIFIGDNNRGQSTYLYQGLSFCLVPAKSPPASLINPTPHSATFHTYFIYVSTTYQKKKGSFYPLLFCIIKLLFLLSLIKYFSIPDFASTSGISPNFL